VPLAKKEAKPSKTPPRCEFCYKGYGVTKVGTKSACFACAKKAEK
jgi:hypothetical protein